MLLENADWPLFGWVADIRSALEAASADGQAVVLATLVRTQGSCPRPIGSQMLFRGGQATGYFSGGCVEADIANHAEEVLHDGRPRRLVYGIGSPWLDIRLLCGGSIELFLERIEPGDPAVATLASLRKRRRSVEWRSNGENRLASAATTALPAFAADADGYRMRYDPDWQLIVVGGDPVALALAQLGSQSGFSTILMRPNGPLSDVPLPGVQYVRADAKQEIKAMRLDRWSAVITAMHDEDMDDGVLISALRSDASYVGVLGATKRIPERLVRLAEAGISSARIDTLRAPIGAVRCGKAPWEIAVSTIAEVMQTRTLINESMSDRQAGALADQDFAAGHTAK